jgi:hypothetical protein
MQFERYLCRIGRLCGLGSVSSPSITETRHLPSYHCVEQASPDTCSPEEATGAVI